MSKLLRCLAYYLKLCYPRNHNHKIMVISQLHVEKEIMLKYQRERHFQNRPSEFCELYRVSMLSTIVDHIYNMSKLTIRAILRTYPNYLVLKSSPIPIGNLI